MMISSDLSACLIHYPRCWDEDAYPSLQDALLEIEHCRALFSSYYFACTCDHCPDKESSKMSRSTDLKNLIPEVEVVSCNFKKVTATSELMLKHLYPGVICIARNSIGHWTGLIIEKGETK